MQACQQVFIHLSDTLFDNVLDQIYNYASSSTTTHVTVVNKLVNALTIANPQKTLARFIHACVTNIELELDYGASSLRTISSRDPIPSDSKLLWSMYSIHQDNVMNHADFWTDLAILGGILKYVIQFLTSMNLQIFILFQGWERS